MSAAHNELLISQLIWEKYRSYEDNDPPKISAYTHANSLKQSLFKVYKEMQGYTILYIQCAMEKKNM